MWEAYCFVQTCPFDNINHSLFGAIGFFVLYFNKLKYKDIKLFSHYKEHRLYTFFASVIIFIINILIIFDKLIYYLKFIFSLKIFKN